jgi:sec-independent protein translocase protein TatB
LFGIGPMEIVVIIVVALLFVGPQKLPELAKQMGKFIVHAKRMTTDVRSTVDGYMKQAESEIIAEEREKIKQLIEAEIGAAEPVVNEHDQMHPDHDHVDHPKDEYFESAEDDPAYTEKNAQPATQAVDSDEEHIWEKHSKDEKK